jgi:hypothetical protein
VFADLDNDAWKDLVLANGHVQDNVGEFHTDLTYEQTPLLFRNLGGARYADVSRSAGPPFQVPIVARGLARGDLDDDGRLDLAITRNNGPAHIWLNRTPGAGHWLKVRLIGAKANTNGFGARVTAVCGTMRQVLELQSGGSYLSQSDQRLHFGLGSATKVDRLEVRWPRGTEEVLTDVPADQLIEVKEGSSPAREGAR